MHCIICQLHEKLLITVQIRVIVLVLLRACSNVALVVLVNLAISRVQKHPLPDVEFTVEVQQRLFDQLLDYKGVVFVLLIGSIAILVLLNVGLMVMVVRLEDGLLVPITSTDAVIVAHNFP